MLTRKNNALVLSLLIISLVANAYMIIVLFGLPGHPALLKILKYEAITDDLRNELAYLCFSISMEVDKNKPNTFNENTIQNAYDKVINNYGDAYSYYKYDLYYFPDYSILTISSRKYPMLCEIAMIYSDDAKKWFILNGQQYEVYLKPKKLEWIIDNILREAEKQGFGFRMVSMKPMGINTPTISPTICNKLKDIHSDRRIIEKALVK